MRLVSIELDGPLEYSSGKTHLAEAHESTKLSPVHRRESIA
jgi:hypothetical protein